ncbi:hypothetical protein [Sphingomonas colocasiae]|uniref:Sel1 repeat family protein n=1 Tax=Sphingomonas colocasiae TaxID=1848973 RepID=A0ABS7PVZ0_9SPHN|nr:hypothetical protein [Sphingomonas colocasiae]MBY8825533.1 hypothetical protein [Sphingomonas colocasiae]
MKTAQLSFFVALSLLGGCDGRTGSATIFGGAPKGCADLATHPLELDGPKKGVWGRDLDAAAAEKACAEDVAARPKDPAAHFHLARAKEASGDGEAAAKSYLAASALGYPLADYQLGLLAARIDDQPNTRFYLQRALTGFSRKNEAGHDDGRIGYAFTVMIYPDGKPQGITSFGSAGRALHEAAGRGYAEVLFRLAMDMRATARAQQFRVPEAFQLTYLTMLEAAATNGKHPDAAMVQAEKFISDADHDYRRGGIFREYGAHESLQRAKRRIQTAIDGGIEPARIARAKEMIEEIETRGDRQMAAAIGTLLVLMENDIKSGAYARRMDEMFSAAPSTPVRGNWLECTHLISNAYNGDVGSMYASMSLNC